MRTLTKEELVEYSHDYYNNWLCVLERNRYRNYVIHFETEIQNILLPITDPVLVSAFDHQALFIQFMMYLLSKRTTQSLEVSLNKLIGSTRTNYINPNNLLP